MNINNYLKDYNFYKGYIEKVFHYQNVFVHTIKCDEKNVFLAYKGDNNFIATHQIKIKDLEKYILSLRREQIEKLKNLIK